MGWRYRKSKKLPGGGRINISKSGIGFSWGTKHHRITKTATGQVRTTTRVPGTNISYSQNISNGKRSGNMPSKQYRSTQRTTPKKRSKRGCGFAALVCIAACIVFYAIYFIYAMIRGFFDPEWLESQTSSESELNTVSISDVLPESSTESSEYSTAEDLSSDTSSETTASQVEQIETDESKSGDSTTGTYSEIESDPDTVSETYSEIISEPEIEPESSEESATLQFVSAPTSVARSSDAYVQVKGAPNTDYRITVMYKSGASDADGLYTKTSDADGYVSWTWHIGGKTSLNFQPTITVSGGGQSISTKFTVTD